MVILHVAAITNEPTAGVPVVVPQHLKAQSAREQVALLNVTNIHIDAVEQQFEYRAGFGLEQLMPPFSRPDLVVFHGTYYVEFLRIASHLRQKHIPYVIVPHGALAEAAQRKKWLKKKVANLVFFNRFFDGAAAMQFLSEHEMNCSKYKAKGFIGTNGVPIPGVRAYPNQHGPVKMVYIGRTEVHIKGLDMLIEAVSHNRRLFEGHKIHLDIYGPDQPNGHAQIKRLISRYDVGDYVTLHQAVVGREKERVLSDADIFIQTSRSEGMPMGILEALSYSIPCMITTGTGLGPMINRYGAGWVAETNTESIAKVMEKAISERDVWEAKAEQAKKVIAENYTWEKAVQDTLPEYQRIVRMHGR